MLGRDELGRKRRVLGRAVAHESVRGREVDAVGERKDVAVALEVG
jgi:hypothetical protein